MTGHFHGEVTPLFSGPASTKGQPRVAGDIGVLRLPQLSLVPVVSERALVIAL
jgi:hypothetical protein